MRSHDLCSACWRQCRLQLLLFVFEWAESNGEQLLLGTGALCPAYMSIFDGNVHNLISKKLQLVMVRFLKGKNKAPPILSKGRSNVFHRKIYCTVKCVLRILVKGVTKLSYNYWRHLTLREVHCAGVPPISLYRNEHMFLYIAISSTI